MGCCSYGDIHNNKCANMTQHRVINGNEKLVSILNQMQMQITMLITIADY